MTADEILKLAGELVASKLPKSEALCRSIVGRSYYAAYQMSLELFADMVLPRSSNHKDASRWLIELGDPNGKKAGKALDTLYEVRRRADYDLKARVAVAESRDLAFIRAQVEMAAEVKGLLALCAVEPARSQVRAAILAFHQRTTRPRGS